MSKLETLIGHTGATKIVLVDHEFWESASTHADTTTHVYVCYIKDKPHKVTAVWSTNVYKTPAGGFSVHSIKPITETEYAEAAAGKPVLDTPEALQNIARLKQARTELEALFPTCPTCNTKMVQRSSYRGSFWGCQRYPKCKGTRQLGPDVRQRITQLTNEIFRLH